MQKIEVKNGTRVDVAFTDGTRGGYTGPAAIVETEGGGQVFFPAKAADLRGIATGTVDGKRVTVQAVDPSARLGAIQVVSFVWAV